MIVQKLATQLGRQTVRQLVDRPCTFSQQFSDSSYSVPQIVIMWNLLPLVAAVHVSSQDWNVQNAYLTVVAAFNLYIVPGIASFALSHTVPMSRAASAFY